MRQPRRASASPNPRNPLGLFSRLPAEVRLRIWTFAIGNSTIHPFFLRGSDSSVVACAICPLPPYPLRRFKGAACGIHPDKHGEPWVNFHQYSAHNMHVCSRCRWQDDQEHQFHPLPLLRSCKLIYEEALPILYATNTFAFYHLRVLSKFSSIISHRHTALIRKLVLTWNFMLGLCDPESVLDEDDEDDSDSFRDHRPPWDYKTWSHSCALIGNMTGLKSLTVIIYERHGHSPKDDDLFTLIWARELRKLHPHDVFDVVYERPDLPQDIDLIRKSLRALGKLPFRVVVPDFDTEDYVDVTPVASQPSTVETSDELVHLQSPVSLRDTDGGYYNAGL